MAEELTAQQAFDQFWPKAMEEIRSSQTTAMKHQELPLARIKKIMKLDEEVKMISAEAPVLFAKAAEIFINELTMRAWIHTEDNKRRTLQRNDIAMAITKYDQFDFLIDIVPREEIKPPTTKTTRDEMVTTSVVGSTGLIQGGASAVRVVPDQVTYYFQQQQQQSTQQPGQQTVQPQIIQLQPQQMVNTIAPPPGGIQIVQQIIGANGEIQQIPIQLTNQQLQLIRAQMTGPQQQPLVIQTAPIQASTLQVVSQPQQSQQGQSQQGQH